jgi:hypothetical protein
MLAALAASGTLQLWVILSGRRARKLADLDRVAGLSGFPRRRRSRFNFLNIGENITNVKYFLAIISFDTWYFWSESLPYKVLLID